ncbi:glycerol-3-phosphate acyltransferase [Leptospira congkakensis]|uniref:Glycerol-3-phosphate acyltransferase n=1 Tax=Leptospira congkakensis TaxID=2484932 RepID=A0A4Z1AFX4_9LEPT|nr:1-acyl-sn-glycerol-3-phosphate acyltransferase [Leptospira congkakensis]TGL90307.1 glycerol-3-phosphate acyltransferase [Leptospira congkakensis]TGL91314.1 glycerol-3-phosphate acyltransferase [Leptospira congkakensis]TGL98366.1 glycerol-3-phosphate acyltransferase [Leptospira congkakensis]
MTEKEATLGRWHKEFFENIHLFVKSGLTELEAKSILEEFLVLSQSTPKPKVMDIFQEPERLEEIGVYTDIRPEPRDFMLKFLDPIMKKFKVEGTENLKLLDGVIGKYPVTLISNHLSHLDAPAIFTLLYNAGPEGRKIAESLVFIAGRLAFEPDFTRLGLYMFGTLLVCSKKDMADNPSLSDVMTKINMRAFRNSQKLQSDGKVISIFPEGTRSRDGRLMPFVDTVYHYVANKVILPISLEGTEKILPIEGLLFNQAVGKLVIGKPVLVGELTKKEMETFPKHIEQISFPGTGDKKQFIIDNLALLVGSNLNKHKHGTYRNLYKGDVRETNQLIPLPKKPDEHVVIIGSSNMSVAFACVMANKNVKVTIYTPDSEIVKQSNEERRDVVHYPIYKLPPNIEFSDKPEVMESATLFIQGTNPWEFDSIYSKIRTYLQKNKSPMVNVIKGFTGSKKGLILEDLNELLLIERERLAVVSGACYPDQIMERKISGFEISAFEDSLIPKLQDLLSNNYVFTRTAINSRDTKGVQLGGALKTIYALAMGLVEGYFKRELGGNVDNTLFHLSNRFFNEMVSIGVLLGGDPTTFNGLSGMTDFMLACFGSDTRDRKYGYDLANGTRPEKITNGFYGLKVLPNLIQLDEKRHPIVTAAYRTVIQNEEFDSIAEKLQMQLARF